MLCRPCRKTWSKTREASTTSFYLARLSSQPLATPHYASFLTLDNAVLKIVQGGKGNLTCTVDH